jgi:hypothetical protein
MRGEALLMNKSESILRPCLYKIAHNARSSRRASINDFVVDGELWVAGRHHRRLRKARVACDASGLGCCDRCDRLLFE